MRSARHQAPEVVAGQVHGGAASGIAQALMEEFVYDEDGIPKTANFLDYVVDAEIDEAGRVEGTITITLNGRLNALPLGGTFENEVLTLDFSGATLVGGPVRGLWNGEIDASFE